MELVAAYIKAAQKVTYQQRKAVDAERDEIGGPLRHADREKLADLWATMRAPNRKTNILAILERDPLVDNTHPALSGSLALLPYFGKPRPTPEGLADAYRGALFVLVRDNGDGTSAVQGGGNFDREDAFPREGAVPTLFDIQFWTDDPNVLPTFMWGLEHFPQQTLDQVFGHLKPDSYATLRFPDRIRDVYVAHVTTTPDGGQYVDPNTIVHHTPLAAQGSVASS